MNYTIKTAGYTATVSDHGAELISLKAKDGSELMWQSPSESFWSKHSPLLFPICGRIKDGKYTYLGKEYKMSPHGFISKKKFTVKKQADDSITLCCLADEDTLLQYPFDFELCAEYSLSKNGLTCRVTVKNLDEKTMPYMFGWHPGFMLPTDKDTDIESYSIEFGNVNKVTWTPLQNGAFARPYGEDFSTPCGKYTLCEEQIYKNDTMIFSDVPTSIRLTTGKSYTLDMSWSDNTPYLCLWKEPSHDAKFICIEPWSSLPGDGDTDECFDTRAMRRLMPGESEIFSVSFKFTV